MEGTAEVNETVESSTEALNLKRKENNETPQQPESCNELETSAPAVSRDTDWPEHFSLLRSPEMLPETIAGKNLFYNVHSQSGSGPFCTSPHSSSSMVEELTLKNYKNPNLAIGGSSNTGEKQLIKNGLWQNFTRIAGGPRGSPHREATMMGAREDVGHAFLPPFRVQRTQPSVQLDNNHSKVSEHVTESDNRMVSSDANATSPGGIQTKVLASPGFAQFLVRNTLKGKGVAYKHQGTHGAPGMVIESQSIERPGANGNVPSNPSHKPPREAGGTSLFGGGGGGILDSHHDGISLREWLKPKSQKINKLERLHIFKKIVELVDVSHAQGLALKHLRPSYFIIMPSKQVKYIGSFSPQGQMDQLEGSKEHEFRYLERDLKRKGYMVCGIEAHGISSPKHQKLGEHNGGSQHHIHPARGGLEGDLGVEVNAAHFKAGNSGSDFREQSKHGESYSSSDLSHSPSVSSSSSQKPMPEIMKLEERWYASPEELNGRICSFSSNIYSLGVLLFELFGYFETWEVHYAAMSDLRHRILPPKFLSESPKETGFCLWLLHPEPSSRPKSRDILQCNLICEGDELSSLDHSSVSIDEEDIEADLLLHFLLSLQEQKEKQAAKLVSDIGCLNADIDEVERRHSLRAEVLSNGKDLPTNLSDVSDRYPHEARGNVEGMSRLSRSSIYEERLMRNIDQLEHAYFSMRSKIGMSESNYATRSDSDILKIHDKCYQVKNDADSCKEPSDSLGAFFDGLCKYARYSKFEVRGNLRNVDMLNSANVICSLSFDRDEDYFAAAGVSKKIKIFEFGALLNDAVDIHYPLIEMSSRSKLSCVCWNSYIKNYLASTDYEGVVQLWDASTGQGFMQLIEHQKRAWSVSFSQVDPTKLASGSDDCSVKLWSINEKNCINTIRNKANVCCVQFSSHSAHLLAFGSADYKIRCYDLRYTRIPWCTLSGHGKAVSYVKFLDSETLVSASTDNTLKLWDLKRTIASDLSTDACALTLSGHTNEKNFVGLSVCDGYIACGSESNDVYAYHRTFPMPITSHEFGSIDPITGHETTADNSQFVSSVCWRGKSNMVVAANSTGSIKVLQLV